MGAKKKAAAAGTGAVAAARAAKNNQYIQRLIEDEDLRQNLVDAYESARAAQARIANGKGPAKVVLDDKKFQKNLRDAAQSLKDAGDALREGKKKRRGGFGRLLVLGIVGGGLAIALNEGLRKKVLDALFGAEEEFEYTSTTSTPSTSSPPAGTTA